MPVPLKARVAFPYAGRSLRPGQSFDAVSKQDAHLLVTIGHAERLPVYETRVMTAPMAHSLDGMALEELRALAAKRGIKVHHRAGIEKLKAALR